jgi:hypothetical protein
VIVAFDDRYADSAHDAKPSLARYDVPTMVFLTIGYIGHERESWWDNYVIGGQSNAGASSLEALREGQTRHEAGTQSLRASLAEGASQAAEQSGRAFFEALPRGKEGDGAHSYHPWHSVICEVSAGYTVVCRALEPTSLIYL